MNARIRNLLAIIGIFATVMGLWMLQEFHQTYTLTGTIIGESDGYVLCEDLSGNLWEFENLTNLRLGESVELVMNNNGTRAEITDDIVMRIR